MVTASTYAKRNNPEAEDARLGIASIGNPIRTDDLRQEIPVLGSADQSRMPNGYTRQPLQMVPPPHPHRAHLQPTIPTMFDTDTSHIEGSLTTVSSPHDRAPPTNGHQVQDHELGGEYAAGSDAEHEIGEDDDGNHGGPHGGDDSEEELSDDLPEQLHDSKPFKINDGLSERQIAIVNARKRPDVALPTDGNRIGHMKGDTYPSQSSGPPSDISYELDARTKSRIYASETGLRILPTRDSGRQRSLRSGYRPPPEAPFNGPPSESVGGSRTDGQVHDQPMQQAIQPQSQPPAQQLLPQFTDRQIYQRDSRRIDTPQARPESRKQSKPPGPARGDTQHSVVPVTVPQFQSHAQGVQPEHNRHVHGHNQQCNPTSVPDQQLVDRRRVTEHRNEEAGSIPPDLPQEESSPKLDHDPPALYRMDYAELKSQEFDIDPNASSVLISEGVRSDSLTDRMNAFSTLASDQQSAFFSSLKIGEWEEAGDWFLECFGELLGEFKAARQKKRKAARTFEDEIEQRHEVVVKKRQATDLALKDMKSVGSQVLQFTPQRTKKVR